MKAIRRGQLKLPDKIIVPGIYGDPGEELYFESDDDQWSGIQPIGLLESGLEGLPLMYLPETVAAQEGMTVEELATHNSPNESTLLAYPLTPRRLRQILVPKAVILVGFKTGGDTLAYLIPYLLGLADAEIVVFEQPFAQASGYSGAYKPVPQIGRVPKDHPFDEDEDPGVFSWGLFNVEDYCYGEILVIFNITLDPFDGLTLGQYILTTTDNYTTETGEGDIDEYMTGEQLNDYLSGIENNSSLYQDQSISYSRDSNAGGEGGGFSAEFDPDSGLFHVVGIDMILTQEFSERNYNRWVELINDDGEIYNRIFRQANSLGVRFIASQVHVDEDEDPETVFTNRTQIGIDSLDAFAGAANECDVDKVILGEDPVFSEVMAAVITEIEQFFDVTL